MPKLTRQQLLLAGLILVFVVVYYFRDQIGVAVADQAGKYWPLPAAGEPYAPIIQSAALQHGVPFDLIARELWEESHFDPNAYNSNSGAIGIAQFEPATAADLGIDPTDPNQAIPGLAKYWSVIRSYIDNNIDGDVTWAMVLAGYDDGEGRVAKAVNADPVNWLVGMKEETRKYVGQILTDVPVEPLPPGALT